MIDIIMKGKVIFDRIEEDESNEDSIIDPNNYIKIEPNFYKTPLLSVTDKTSLNRALKPWSFIPQIITPNSHIIKLINVLLAAEK